MTANFQDDLNNKGKVGEKKFHELNPELERTDGFEGDFITPNGKKIELKTDSYDMNRTYNFFIERYSDYEKKTPGGPWQAQTHKCEKYVYFFINNLKAFVFDTEELIKAVEAQNLKLTAVKNKSWITMGYKVKRSTVINLAKLKDYNK